MMIRILLLSFICVGAIAQSDWRGFQFDDSTRAVRPPNTFMKANSLTTTNRQVLSGASVNVDTKYAEHFWTLTADGTFALTNDGTDTNEVQTVHLVINADAARNVTNTTDTLVPVGRWGNLISGLNTLTFVRVNTSWVVYQDTALIESDEIVGLVDSEATIASATTTELDSTDSFWVSITGTTTITSFGTATAGIWKAGRFTGATTLTHNATSLILPGAANITTAAGDRFMAKSLGSGNWVVYFYVKADGTPIAIGDNTIALGTKTTGNYAAGDAEAGAATSGDNATGFFSTGQIERARGGTGADTSAYGAGLLGSDGSNNTIDVDTEAELETAVGSSLLTPTEGNAAYEAKNANLIKNEKTFTFVSDSEIADGSFATWDVPWAITITGYAINSEPSGSLEFFIWMETDPYDGSLKVDNEPTIADSVVASAPPTITSGTGQLSTSVGTWDTTWPALSRVKIGVTSATTTTRGIITIYYTK